MKILHIYGHNYGGSFVLTQARELKQLGHHVTVICPSEGPFSKQLQMIGVEYKVFDFQGSSIKSLFRISKAIIDIRNFIKNFQPDIIHCHLIKAIIVGRLSTIALNGINLVSELGGPLTLEDNKFRMLDLLTIYRDDHIICSSSWIYNFYDKYQVTNGKKSLLHYAFDFERFTGFESKEYHRNDTENTIVFGMVSHLYNVKFKKFGNVGLKGHELLIQAVSLLKEYNLDFRFVIVGQDIDGGNKYLNELIRLTDTFGVAEKFEFVGHASDVNKYLHMFDVAIVPSLTENCGGAVEPLLLGKPVIASNTGGLPDVVIPGETGWLFKVGDSVELSQAILLAYRTSAETRAEMGIRGNKLVDELFEPKKNVIKLISIYERILERTN